MSDELRGKPEYVSGNEGKGGVAISWQCRPCPSPTERQNGCLALWVMLKSAILVDFHIGNPKAS